MDDTIINPYSNDIISIDYALLQSINYLTTFSKREYEIKFLLDTTNAAMILHNLGRDVYHPRFENWKPFIPLCENYHETIQNINSCKTDSAYIEKYGINNYKFLVMTLFTSNVKFQPKEFISAIGVYQYMVIHGTGDMARDTNGMSGIQSPVKIKEYLFHGSIAGNWYSILRNGLQSFSHTKFQEHGASYGAGIYMSNDMSISIAYTSTKETKIVGVYEVELVYANKFKKSENIFVFPDNKYLTLKYFFKFDKEFDMNIIKGLTTYFKSDLQSINTKYNQNVSSICIKRLNSEFKRLKDVFPIEIVNDTISIWHIKLKIDRNENQLLYDDMVSKNIQHILIEIIFPNDYPIAPPFVRIVEPRFSKSTGYVTSGGSICTDLLTRTMWSASCSVESILIMIKTLIGEGKGRLASKNWNVPYTITESKESYKAILKAHGWI